MGRIYDSGDIVLFNNIKLINNKGEGVIDTRIKGHPCIILNEINEFGETALCLKCSSSKKGKRRGLHLRVDNIRIKGMRQKPTYVEIMHIYKIEIEKMIVPVGRVSNKLLSELKEEVKDKIIIN